MKRLLALTQKALSLQRSGNIQAALDSLYRVIDIRIHGEYIDYVHAAESYNLIAAIHNQQGHYDEAIKQGCQKHKFIKTGKFFYSTKDVPVVLRDRSARPAYRRMRKINGAPSCRRWRGQAMQ